MGRSAHGLQRKRQDRPPRIRPHVEPGTRSRWCSRQQRHSHQHRRATDSRRSTDHAGGVTTMMELSGIHHLTAISAKIAENHRFYTQTLGMRLVKRSVNQDDVSAYHLFYADAKGTPGSDITFFDWPMPPEQRGRNAIVGTSLRVTGKDSLEYWRARLKELGVQAGEIAQRDGRLVLDLEDGEGQRLSLVDA